MIRMLTAVLCLALAAASGSAVSQHLGVPPAATQILFVDIERGDWLNGDKLLPGGLQKE